MRLTISLLLASCCLFACTGNKASADSPARPAAAGTGPEVAHVHLVDGAATVIAANGHRFAAAPGIPLLRSDQVEAGETSFVVLRLSNNYLVRIDEEIALAVTDIYLLDAPKAADDLERQLNRMLTKDEIAKGERIAGWHARLTGAQTVAPLHVSQEKKNRRKMKSLQETEAPREEALRKAPAAQPSPERPPPPKPPRTSLSAKKPKRMKMRGGKADDQAPLGGGGGPGASVATGAAAKDTGADGIVRSKGGRSATVWFLRVGSKQLPGAGAAPALVEQVAADQELRSCLREAVSALPVKAQSVQLMLRVKDFRVQKVRLSGGLPAPACASKGILHKPIPEVKQDGWVIIEVPLR